MGTGPEMCTHAQKLLNHSTENVYWYMSDEISSHLPIPLIFLPSLTYHIYTAPVINPGLYVMGSEIFFLERKVLMIVFLLCLISDKLRICDEGSL